MKTILLANHDTFVRTAQKDILTKNGYMVLGEAETVEQSVEKFKRLNPDLVIVDFHPVEFDCIRAMKEMRNINSSAIFVICSSFVANGPVVEAITLGAKGWAFPQLPHNSDMLLEQVAWAFEN